MEFGITFVPRKVIKGQGMADFLAAHPLPADSSLNFDLPEEETLWSYCGLPTQEVGSSRQQDEHALAAHTPYWELYFDGASRTVKLPDGHTTFASGAGIVLVTPQGGILHNSCALIKPLTNNEAEYKALIIGLQLALEMGIANIKAYGDSQLVIRQVSGVYDVRKQELIPYHNMVMKLKGKFQIFEIGHVPRGENSQADALAKLASALKLPPEGEMDITVKHRRLMPTDLDEAAEFEALEVACIEDENTLPEDDWRQPIIKIKNRWVPPERAQRV